MLQRCNKRKALLEVPRRVKLNRDAFRPSATFHSMPADLLGVIFALVPSYPRLWVLSRVCKRWRRSVMKTFDSFPLRGANFTVHPSKLATMASLFPCLTRLDLTNHLPRTLGISARLKSIKYSARGPDDDRLGNALRGVQLRLFKLSLHGTASTGSFSLLQSSVLSIHKLSFHLQLPAELASNFGAEFPHLRAVHVTCWPSRANTEIAEFIARHALQLESIKLDGMGSAACLARVVHAVLATYAHFPRLRTLSVVWDGSRELIALLPKLSTLPDFRLRAVLTSSDAFNELPMPCLESLTAVTICNAAVVTDLSNQLQCCRRLTSFDCKLHNVDEVATHGTNRVSAVVPTLRFVFAPYSSWPNLTSISLAYGLGAGPRLPERLDFPALREARLDVAWTDGRSCFTHLLVHLRHWLIAAPRLSRLEFNLDELISNEHLNALGLFLADLEKRCMQRVTLRCRLPREVNGLTALEAGPDVTDQVHRYRELRALRKRLLWLQLVVNFEFTFFDDDEEPDEERKPGSQEEEEVTRISRGMDVLMHDVVTKHMPVDGIEDL